MWVLGEALGPTLPNGETRKHDDWRGRLLEKLATHPDLEPRPDRDRPGKTGRPAFRVRKGRVLKSVDLGYSARFETAWPRYEELVQPMGRRFQVGIPGHVDAAAIAFGFSIPDALRHLAPFREATIREMAAIWARGGSQVTFQLEVPVELIILTKIPPPARWAAAKRFAREILKLVEAAPSGSSYGVHLCLGDRNDDSLLRPADTRPLVALANALMIAWPEGRVLEYLHVPMVMHGSEFASMDPDYYAPLTDLWLPDHVRFIGGFIHENGRIKDLVKIRDQIEYNLDRRIDVGAACGLGRRERWLARRNLDIAMAVASDDE